MAIATVRGRAPRVPAPGVEPRPSLGSVDDYFQNLDIGTETKKEDNAGVRKARRLTIKGVTPDDKQRENMETVIATAQETKGSSTRSILAAIVAVIQESAAKNLPDGDGTSSGILQVTQSTGVLYNIDPRDIEACVEHFCTKGFYKYGGANDIAKKNPNFNPGDIAWRVQGCAAQFNHLYAKWIPEAKKWLEAVEGGRVEGGGRKEYRKQYQYKREKGEDSWDCMQRLAGEVEWRCFPLGRVLVYMSEVDLFRRRIAYTVTPQDDALIELTYDIDWRSKVPANEAVLTVNLDRWGAPPGYPIQLDGFGPPDGRWLIISVRRNWFSPTAEVTLRQPMVPQKEPDDAGTGSRQATGGEQDGSGITLYRKCRQISDAKGPYVYGGGHGAPLSSLKSGQGLDCSSSTSLALYRAKLWDHRGTARVSGEFSDWGRKGRGNIFTVCYNSGHVYIRFEDGASVDAKRFDTSGWGSGGRGPRLRFSEGPPGDAGYSLRHWPDM